MDSDWMCEDVMPDLIQEIVNGNFGIEMDGARFQWDNAPPHIMNFILIVFKIV